MRDVIYVIGSYAFGAIPHLYLLGRLKGLRLQGDLHMALWREGGRPIGALGLLLELVKGVSVILAGRAMGLDIGIIVLGGLAVVLGSVARFYHLTAKGQLVGVAMAAALTPGPFWLAAVIMITGYLIRTLPRFMARGVSVNEKLKLGGPPSLSFPLGMILGFAALPLFAWWLGQPPVVVAGYGALLGFILIRRATAGLFATSKPAGD